MLEKKPPQRVPGTAVFLTSDPHSAPTALLHSLKHYKVLHEKNVILSIETEHTPRVPVEERVRIEPVGQAFPRVTLRFHPTTDAYEKATGQPWFTSGTLVRGEIHVLPLATLRDL